MYIFLFCIQLFHVVINQGPAALWTKPVLIDLVVITVIAVASSLYLSFWLLSFASCGWKQRVFQQEAVNTLLNWLICGTFVQHLFQINTVCMTYTVGFVCVCVATDSHLKKHHIWDQFHEFQWIVNSHSLFYQEGVCHLTSETHLCGAQTTAPLWALLCRFKHSRQCCWSVWERRARGAALPLRSVKYSSAHRTGDRKHSSTRRVHDIHALTWTDYSVSVR